MQPSSVPDEFKYDDGSPQFLMEEKKPQFLMEEKKMKLRRKARGGRKIKAPKFRSFKAPRHVSRKVKDLKDLKELRLVTSLSNSFKKLGNHKPVKLSPFTYKSNIRNTRLRPRFKQQKGTRTRRASSALVVRAELEELFAEHRFRSSSYELGSNEGAEREHDKGELEQEEGAGENGVENNSSYDSLNEFISEEDRDVVAPLRPSPMLSPGSNRRLLKTSSGSGVYFADGYFEMTLRRKGDSFDFGLTLEEFKSSNASPNTLPTLTIVQVADALCGKHGDQIPPGTLTVGDQLVKVNNVEVHSQEDVHRILRASARSEVDLGIRHGGGFTESKQDDPHGELSSSSGGTSPDNSPYTDGVEESSEWFDAEMDSSKLDRDWREGQHLVLKVLPDRVHVLTSNGEDITYSKIQEDISEILQVPLTGDDWRVWFTNQLDQLCESGLFTVLGMDMETMSPVLSRVM